MLGMTSGVDWGQISTVVISAAVLAVIGVIRLDIKHLHNCVENHAKKDARRWRIIQRRFKKVNKKLLIATQVIREEASANR